MPHSSSRASSQAGTGRPATPGRTREITLLLAIGVVAAAGQPVPAAAQCVAPGTPANPSPAAGASLASGNVTFTWSAATGTAPITYQVLLDGLNVVCTTTATSCSLAGVAGSHNWRVAASNACGNTTGGPWTFAVAAACTAASAPVAAFTVEPSGTVIVGGVAQPQPYVGQQVTLRGAATNGPVIEWSWYDFGSVGVLLKTQDVAYVWDTAGSKNVRLIARNCFGSSQELLQPVVVHADVRPAVAGFAWSPAPGQVGSAVTFTAATGAAYGDPTSFEWTFPGGVTRTGAMVEHVFNCAGTHQVTLVAARGGIAGAPTTRAVGVAGSPVCCAAPNRAGSPAPANGATVPGGVISLQWARPTLGTDPLRYDVILDGATVPGCANIAARQCAVTVAEGAATHFWKVIARSACGATTDVDTPSEWRFKACSAPSVPDATAFTWQPTGQIVVGGVVQQQPYPGQEVRFSYASSVPATALSWTDYQKVPAVVHGGVTTPLVVYASAGDKKMYLRASNCAGTRAITQYVKVYQDVRPVAAAFKVAPADPAAFDLVTVTFDTSTAAGSPDEFTVDFGDGTPKETVSAGFVQHAYRCGRTYRITVTARRTRFGSKAASAASAVDLPVSGLACAPSGFLLVDVPQSVLRTDGSREAGGVAVFNPTDQAMDLVLSVRDTASGELRTGLALPLLAPKGYLGLSDLVALGGIDFARATLWLENADPDATEVPVVNAWSFLERTSSQRYWQYLPVAAIWPPATGGRTYWISGLIHNSLNAERGRYGSITRLTFVDPTVSDAGREPWGSRKLILRLYDGRTGQLVRTDSLNLDTFGGYRSDYLNRIFHLADGQDFGTVMVRIDVPAGVSAIATAAVVDNATGSARLSAAH